MVGSSDGLTDRIEQTLISGGQKVWRVDRDATRSRASWHSAKPSRAVLHTVLPTGGGRDLRDFRRKIAIQASEIAQVMSARSSILIVADQPHDRGADAFRFHRLDAILTRMRAAAQQQLASTLTVNAVVLSGRINEDTTVLRICEALQGRGMPDTDFVVVDEQLRHQTIASVIAEECS